MFKLIKTTKERTTVIAESYLFNNLHTIKENQEKEPGVTYDIVDLSSEKTFS